jgi:heterotetrameric sarcosine oxidase gamma subunit
MGEPDRIPAPAAFELSSIPAGRAILHLKAWVRVPLSLAGFDSHGWGGARLLALGPGEWLMMSHGIEDPDLNAGIASLARSRGLAAVDVSDGMAVLELKGSAARDILSTACGLDLHPKVFPEGSGTRTRLAQLPVVIVCTGMSRFEMYVGTSYASYLEAWLRDAGAAMID